MNKINIKLKYLGSDERLTSGEKYTVYETGINNYFVISDEKEIIFKPEVEFNSIENQLLENRKDKLNKIINLI